MATSTASPQVRQLREEGEARVEEAVRLFTGVIEDQAIIVTEIGWTVGATAAHLASATQFTAMQLKLFKQGKVLNVPSFIVDALNFFSSRKNRATPIAQSVAKLRETTAANLLVLDDWMDADLDTPFKKPYFGATTYGEALRYSFVGHFDEHMGQVRRALKV